MAEEDFVSLESDFVLDIKISEQKTEEEIAELQKLEE